MKPNIEDMPSRIKILITLLLTGAMIVAIAIVISQIATPLMPNQETLPVIPLLPILPF